MWTAWDVQALYALGDTPQRDHAALLATAHVSHLVLLDCSTQAWSAFQYDGSWVPCAVHLTPPADERVVLDDALRLASYTDAPARHQDRRGNARLCASLQSERDAVHALCERLEQACAYVHGVCDGSRAYDAGAIQSLATAVANAHGVSAPDTTDEVRRPISRQRAAEALWTSCLAAMTESLGALGEVRALPDTVPRAHRVCRAHAGRPWRAAAPGGPFSVEQDTYHVEAMCGLAPPSRRRGTLRRRASAARHGRGPRS